MRSMGRVNRGSRKGRPQGDILDSPAYPPNTLSKCKILSESSKMSSERSSLIVSH